MKYVAIACTIAFVLSLGSIALCADDDGKTESVVADDGASVITVADDGQSFSQDDKPEESQPAPSTQTLLDDWWERLLKAFGITFTSLR